MYTRLLFLLSLFPGVLLCQGPGYMGKRTQAGYGVHVSPVTFGSTANNKTLIGNVNGTAEKGYLRFNVNHEVFLERVLSNNWLMGASVKYMRTGYDNRALLNSATEKPGSYYVINVLSFSPYFKTFRRNYIAPWGKYFVFGPVLNVMRSKHDAFMHIARRTVNGHDTLETDFGSDDKRHFSGDLLMGVGKTRVYFNRITLDYGYNFHLLASLMPLVEVLLYEEPKQEEYIAKTIAPRVRAANRFNLFFRLGYLF